MLRVYQQESVDKSKKWLLSSIEPGLLELATGAGKSHIIAELAAWLHEISGGKKVLVLAPSKELVEQDRNKYLKLGKPASLYCAAAGKKTLKHPVVFGSPQSVKNDIKKFCSKFCAIIIDEAHGLTPTIKEIISHIKTQNPKCRVLGLTATPYRLATGYIYKLDENDNPVPEYATREPFFTKLLHRVTARYLIDNGYLTEPHADPDHIKGYDASNLEVNNRGQFDVHEIEQVFEGKGRLTAAIVADVVEKSAGRKGVLIFAATREHAIEIMESLPKQNSRLITGNTSKPMREKILSDFSAMRFKYLVNVSVLTTGFDAPHVDVVAILRATESVGLLQQIIGRGLRLSDPNNAGDLHAIAKSSKPDCLVFDYAENIERHCPDGDLFNPIIKAKPPKGDAPPVVAICPECGTANEFSGRENPEQFEIDKNGYFVDLSGERILTDSDQPMPAHYGRRCNGLSRNNKGMYDQCSYRWSFKACVNEECGHENDIAARFCERCRAELVDPNEKLVIEFRRMKKDPYTPTTDKVLAWSCKPWIGATKDSLRVEYTTECRTFSVFYFYGSPEWKSLCNAVFGEKVESIQEFSDRVNKNFEGSRPETVTVYKQRSNGFYKIIEHNNMEDLPDAVS